MRKNITDIIIYMMLSLLTIMFVPVSVHASQEQAVTVQNSKIDPTLQTVMDAATEDELISVYLELSEVESLQIDELIASVESPEEKLAIIQEAYAAIANEFLDRYFDESNRDRILFQSGYTTEVVEKVEKAPLDERGLLNSYRTVTKYTSTMAVRATKGEIMAYAMDEDVTVLSLYGFTPEPSVVLSEAKSTAKVELTYYKDVEQYREAQQMEIQEIIKTGFLEIEEAETVDEVRAAVEEAETKMDKVKTDKQLTEQELANQKPDDREQPDNSNGYDDQQKDDQQKDDQQKDDEQKDDAQKDSDTDDGKENGSTSDKNHTDTEVKPSDQEMNVTQEMDVTEPEQKDTDVSNGMAIGNDAANGNTEHYFDASEEKMEQELDEVQKMTESIRSYLNKVIIIVLSILAAVAGYGIWIHRKKKQ